MSNFEALKNYFSAKYGESQETTITFDNEDYTGIMFGNDECFDCNDFYQYFLTTDGKLYKFYFEIPEGTEDFGNLDYDNPTNAEDADAQYWIDYVV